MNADSTTIRGTTHLIRSYRIERKYLALGIIGVVFYLGVDVATILASLWNIDGSIPDPLPMALIGGTVFTLMVLLSILLIVAGIRVRLLLFDDAITYQGCFRCKTVRMTDVTRIVWRRQRPYVTILVDDGSSKIKMELGLYLKDEREELIEFMRTAFTPEIQIGWERFATPPRPPAPRRVFLFHGLGVLLFFTFAGFCVRESVRDFSAAPLASAALYAAIGILFVWDFFRWYAKHKAA